MKSQNRSSVHVHQWVKLPNCYSITADRAKRHVREVLLVDIFFPARADFFLKQAQYFVARKLQFFFLLWQALLLPGRPSDFFKTLELQTCRYIYNSIIYVQTFIKIFSCVFHKFYLTFTGLVCKDSSRQKARQSSPSRR